MAKELSEETKDFYRGVFREKDIDGRGFLTQDELAECLYCCGCCPTETGLEFLIKYFDTNNDGHLSIEELIENIHLIHEHSLGDDDLLEAFQMLDKNNDGFIRLMDIKKVLCHKNFMEPDQASKLISYCVDHYDKDNNGKFNYLEFYEAFTSDAVRAKFMTAAAQLPQQEGVTADEQIQQQIRDGAQELKN